MQSAFQTPAFDAAPIRSESLRPLKHRNKTIRNLVPRQPIRIPTRIQDGLDHAECFPDETSARVVVTFRNIAACRTPGPKASGLGAGGP